MIATLASERGVFVDTSAYFAATNRREERHEAVSRAFPQPISQGSLLITSNFVLAEVHALLLNRIGRDIARRVLQQIEASKVTHVESVLPLDEQRARHILAQYDDKDFSLTDATSFAVMERLGIRRAFTLDRNFAQYGWELVPLT